MRNVALVFLFLLALVVPASVMVAMNYEGNPLDERTAQTFGVLLLCAVAVLPLVVGYLWVLRENPKWLQALNKPRPWWKGPNPFPSTSWCCSRVCCRRNVAAKQRWQEWEDAAAAAREQAKRNS